MAAAIAPLVCAVTSVPATVVMLDSPAVIRAEDGCGDGFYYDTKTFSCEP